LEAGSGSCSAFYVKGRIRKSKIQELKRLRMEPLRGMDAHNGGVETQKESATRISCSEVFESFFFLLWLPLFWTLMRKLGR
jgi:hypothetical protein